MRSTYYKLFIVIIVALLTITAAGCASKLNTAKPADKLKVVTSVYPVYEFTRQVGGDKVEAVMLVPPGAEPHDWEPTPKEIILIKSAKLFLYHGAGLENLGKVLGKETLGATQAVAISQNIPVQDDADTAEEDADQHTAKPNNKDDDHDHADAHMWLDPVYAQQEVLNVANALAAVDPANKDYYLANATRYNQELAALDDEYRRTLTGTTRQDIITSHAAFGYLARRYNIKQVAIMGLSPDSEPTPDKMAKVVKFVKEHKVKYIFFETIVSPRLSEVIAKETGASLLVLNPVESLTEAEMQQGKNYVSVMRDNLANLKKALND